MGERRTHLSIDPELVGRPVELREGSAVVDLTTTARMAADSRGLVHGGFVFGLADYAAMLAVNEPNVVLAGSSSRFRRPVAAGSVLRAVAEVGASEGPKSTVQVSIYPIEVADGADPSAAVYTGEFRCFTPDEHVLSGSAGADR